MLNVVRLAALVVAMVMVVPGLVSAADPVMVKIGPQNNSGESGTATLTDAGDGKTKVTVNVTGQPAGSQPMHIHKGTCANLDPKPAFGLPPLTGGKAEATVNVAMDALQKEKFAINGHKSPQEVSVYVFCGEIPTK
jgi:Cu/Zn superoxide dismutase